MFSNKLDILFVISDEPSMSSHQAKLVASFSTFMSLFIEKGFDFRVAVVTTSAYMADPTLNGYNPQDESLADFNDSNGSLSSGNHVLTPDDPNIFEDFAINAKPAKNTSGQDGRAFSSFRQGLQSTRPINDGFLRPDAYLAVVIVDNEDDFSGNERCVGCNVSGRYNASTLDPVSVYRDFLDNLTQSSGATARYSVSAMTQISTPCQGPRTMARIMGLVEQTQGILGELCQDNFGPSMAEIGANIAMLSSQFFLERKPLIESITVMVNGALVPNDAQNGWTYSEAANSILFHGAATPSEGDRVIVDFDPESMFFD